VSRKKIRLLLSAMVVLPILCVGAGMVLLAWSGYHSVYIQPRAYAPPPMPIFRAARKIYPFSIIPGGVYDPKELAQTVQSDPPLGEHYRDIQIENLIAVRTQAPMQAFVSFRQDKQIYWTSKELTIPRGELVLTDGQHMIRSRCGNRLEQKRPENAVRSSTMTEQMQALIMDAPLPSIANLPPSLQPVLSPGVLVGDLWKDPENQVAATSEPGTLILFGSGALLLFRLAYLKG
jgi:hypothetical protein